MCFSKNVRSTLLHLLVLFFVGGNPFAQAMEEQFQQANTLFETPTSAQEAIELFKLLGEKNYPPALDTLGGLYLRGIHVEKDASKALHYYERGANLGYGPSQFNYGILLKNGQSFQQAFIYLALAALNVKDLDEMTQDAARYRNEVSINLSPFDYQEALLILNHRIS